MSKFKLLLTLGILLFVNTLVSGAQKDILNGNGIFKNITNVSNNNLPKGWSTRSGFGQNQIVKIVKNGNNNFLEFDKLDANKTAQHRIVYKLNNVALEPGVKYTFSFDYFVKVKPADNAGITVGVSTTGGSASQYDGTEDYIDGSMENIINTVKSNELVKVKKEFTVNSRVVEPYILISENYWASYPYTIDIGNIKLTVDDKVDTVAIKPMIKDLLATSDNWSRGEDYGSKLDLSFKSISLKGVAVTFKKDAGGGYYTLVNKLSNPINLNDFQTIKLDADFTNSIDNNMRNINDEGHSGISFWIEDKEGKKAYYDVYSKVPLKGNSVRYYYLLRKPLGPFDGKPDKSSIVALGFQISKINASGNGGVHLFSLVADTKADLGDKELISLYKSNISALSKKFKSNMKNYFVTTDNADSKIKLTYIPAKVNSKTEIKLESAKDATAHAQIIFTPSDKAKNLNISISPTSLKDKLGNKISASNIKVYLVKQLPVRPNDVETKIAAWYPDPLIDTNKIALKNDVTNTMWIQVSVPKTKAGIYSGNIEVKENNKVISKIPVTLNVWDIELPKDNKVRSSWWIFRGMVAKYLGKENITLDEMKPYYKMGLDHRLSTNDVVDGAKPLYKIYKEKDGSYFIDTTEFEEYLKFCKNTNSGVFNGFNIVEFGWFGDKVRGGFDVIDRTTGKIVDYDRSEYSSETLKIAKIVVDSLCDAAEKYDLLKYAYLQPYDEPQVNSLPFFNRITDELKKMNLRVPLLVVFSTNEPIIVDPKLAEKIDIWCPSLYTLRDEDVKHQHDRGKEIWNYVCTGGNPLVTNNIVQDRWFYLETFRKNSQGFLNWGLNYWNYSDRESWEKNKIYTGYTQYDNSAIGQGDGVIFYPGPTASIRLKGLMRGVEDYQFAWLLADTYNKKKDTPKGKSLSGKVDKLLKMENLMKEIKEGNPLAVDYWRHDVAETIIKLK